jgi:hypothetical protein
MPRILEAATPLDLPPAAGGDRDRFPSRIEPVNYLGAILLGMFFVLLLRKRAVRVRLIRKLGYDPGQGMESYRWINAATILTGLTFVASLGIAIIRAQ